MQSIGYVMLDLMQLIGCVMLDLMQLIGYVHHAVDRICVHR